MPKKNAGFTLIEILVTISIVLLIAAVGVPNLKRFTSDQQLDEAASNLVQVLKLAQSSANSSVRCLNGQPSSSWTVNFYQGEYNLVVSCGSEESSTTWKKIGNIPYYPKKPGEIKLSGNSCQTAGDLYLTFDTRQNLRGGCSSGNSNTPYEIILKNNKTNGMTKVKIEAGGVISLEKISP